MPNILPKRRRRRRKERNGIKKREGNISELRGSAKKERGKDEA